MPAAEDASFLLVGAECVGGRCAGVAVGRAFNSANAIESDQYPRMQRPEAAGNDDWIVVGDIPGDPEFSILTWVRLLFSFHGGSRPNKSPFFVDDANHSMAFAALTYGQAMKQFRKLLSKVCTPAEAKRYGLHSLRVAGWNGARRGPAGEDLAIAQGGWHSGSQKRYDRFQADEICDLPRHVIEGADAALSTSARIDPVPGTLPAPPEQASRPVQALGRKRTSLPA